MRVFAFSVCLVVALVGGVSGSVITKVEPNDSIAGAQNVDAFFSLDYSPDIGDALGTNTSTLIPHVTINAVGDDTWDYYSFTVPAGGAFVILDVDYGMNVGGSFDPVMELFDTGGTQIWYDDDSAITSGAGGSVHGFDSFSEGTLSPGLYAVLVRRFGNAPVPADGTYTLQISVESNDVIPEPATLSLLGLGLLAVARRRRKL